MQTMHHGLLASKIAAHKRPRTEVLVLHAILSSWGVSYAINLQDWLLNGELRLLFPDLRPMRDANIQPSTRPKQMQLAR